MDPGLLDALPFALLALQEDRVLWANHAAAQLLGIEPDRLLGARLDELLAPGEARRLEEAIPREGARESSHSLRLARTDGAVLELEVGLHWHETPEGRQLLLSAREVGESRRAEQLMGRLADLTARSGAMMSCDDLLAASERIFRALGWTVGMVDIKGERAQMRHLIAKPAGDPLGDYGRSLMGTEAPLPRFGLVAQVARSGEPLFLESIPEEMPGTAVIRDVIAVELGRLGAARSAWVPIWRAERVGHVLAVIAPGLTRADFVAIQLFAAQLSAAIRMEELRAELVRKERLAAVGEMSAVLAHEVRNPLGVIFNAVSGLRRQMVRATPSAEALLGIVGEEADRLRTLVDDLLDFARPAEPQLRPVSLGQVVTDALKGVCEDPSFRDRHLALQVAVPEDLPEIQADPLLLRRAVVNVLLNAFQHSPQCGKVQVAGSLATEGWLRLRVINDGPPVQPEVAPRIFEPFVTTRATGTGLGLAVVRRIIEELRGRVQLDPGMPVSFSIWLPLAQQDRLSKP